MLFRSRMREHEMPVRRIGSFPPYSRLSLFTLSHKDLAILGKVSSLFASRLEKIGKPLGIDIWGPTDAPMSRWKGVYRHHILARSPSQPQFTTFLQTSLDDWEQLSTSSVKLKLDRDPA